MKDNSKTKIVTNWRTVPGKPPLWSKLWHRLLLNKKEKTAGTHPEKGTNTAQDAGDGGQELSGE